MTLFLHFCNSVTAVQCSALSFRIFHFLRPKFAFFFAIISFYYYYLSFRYFPSVMSDYLDQNLLTFILTSVCTPAFFKNPYLVSKLIEILFVINPAVQDRTQDLFLRMMSHPIAEEHLPSALMTFYTGRKF